MIIGSSGMLGHQLVYQLHNSFEVAALQRYEHIPTDLGHEKAYTGIDIRQLDILKKAIQDFGPSVIVNAAGIIKQLEQTHDKELSIYINALFPHQLHSFCQQQDIRLIHFSTDCVYKGDQKLPYSENQEPDARDLYGLTKYLGEVNATGAITIRSSIIGHELRSGKSLLEWFISNREGEVKGFANALFSGFTTVEMSNIVRKIILDHDDLNGLYNVASKPISKFELLDLINREYKLHISLQRDEDFMMDRSLDGSRFNELTGYFPPDWGTMIHEMRECSYGINNL